jgi:hypothetical protein
MKFVCPLDLAMRCLRVSLSAWYRKRETSSYEKWLINRQAPMENIYMFVLLCICMINKYIYYVVTTKLIEIRNLVYLPILPVWIGTVDTFNEDAILDQWSVHKNKLVMIGLVMNRILWGTNKLWSWYYGHPKLKYVMAQCPYFC